MVQPKVETLVAVIILVGHDSEKRLRTHRFRELELEGLHLLEVPELSLVCEV